MKSLRCNDPFEEKYVSGILESIKNKTVVLKMILQAKK
jgi:hypothetical protein